MGAEAVSWKPGERQAHTARGVQESPHSCGPDRVPKSHAWTSESQDLRTGLLLETAGKDEDVREEPQASGPAGAQEDPLSSSRLFTRLLAPPTLGSPDSWGPRTARALRSPQPAGGCWPLFCARD